MNFDPLTIHNYLLAVMGKTFAEFMKEISLRQKEIDPELMKKESERISLLQKRWRASVNEQELIEDTEKRRRLQKQSKLLLLPGKVL